MKGRHEETENTLKVKGTITHTRWKESREAYEDEKEIGVSDGFKRAIDIVKSGGISKE